MSENSQNVESTSQSSMSTGSIAATVGARSLTSSPVSLQRLGYHSLSEQSLVPHDLRSQTRSSLSQRSHISSRIKEHGRNGSSSSSGASRSAHGKRRSRDRNNMTGEEYWSQWIPATGSTVQQFRSASVGSGGFTRPPGSGEGPSSPPSCAPTPQRPSSGPPGTIRRPPPGAHSDNGAGHPYSLIVNSEHLNAAAKPSGLQGPHRRSIHGGSNTSAGMGRQTPLSRTPYPEPPAVPRHLSGPYQLVPSPPLRSPYGGRRVSASTPHLDQQVVVRPPQLPHSPMSPGLHSIHSSHSSGSDPRSRHNFSYPLGRNHSSRSNRYDTSRVTTGPRASTGTSEMGVDGQIDRSRYRMNRSKSSSTDYSTEDFRRLHGGVIPNIDLESNGRARPPLTRHTSSHYSKLQDLSVPSLPNATRRASYSSATGISPVAERYMNTFAPSASEQPSISRGSSFHQPLTIDTNFMQTDGALSSPRGPGSVPESPIGAQQLVDGQFFPSLPVERKRVDDFGFVNTIEAADRPYTPDQFAFDAGMLNLDPTTTRHSSQKSKRSMASFGAQSRRSAGQASIPTNQNPAGSIGRNVLRKKRPSPKPSQNDMGTFASGGSRPSTAENRGFLTGSLRGRPLDLDYSLDMPHTATTSAGPSRGLIIDGYNIVPGNVGAPRMPSRGSVFSLANGKANPPSAEEKLKDGKTSVSSLLDGFESSNAVSSGRQRQWNDTIPHPSGPKRTISSPELGPESTQNPVTTTPCAEPSADKHSRHLSHLYNEGKQMLRDVWHEGLTAALEDFRDRRAAEKAQRYVGGGKPGTALTSVAQPPSGSTKRSSRIGKKLGESWSTFKGRSKSPPSSSGTDEQRGFQGGHSGTYSGASPAATAAPTTTATDDASGPASPNKRSAFTEMFERTGRVRERSRASSAERGGGRKSISMWPRHSLLRKMKDGGGSVEA